MIMMMIQENGDWPSGFAGLLDLEEMIETIIELIVL